MGRKWQQKGRKKVKHKSKTKTRQQTMTTTEELNERQTAESSISSSLHFISTVATDSGRHIFPLSDATDEPSFCAKLQKENKAKVSTKLIGGRTKG